MRERRPKSLGRTGPRKPRRLPETGLLQADAETFLKGGAVQGDIDVEGKIAERKAAKESKNYSRSDEIRKELEAAGIVLEDKPGGITEWRRK